MTGLLFSTVILCSLMSLITSEPPTRFWSSYRQQQRYNNKPDRSSVTFERQEIQEDPKPYSYGPPSPVPVYGPPSPASVYGPPSDNSEPTTVEPLSETVPPKNSSRLELPAQNNFFIILSPPSEKYVIPASAPVAPVTSQQILSPIGVTNTRIVPARIIHPSGFPLQYTSNSFVQRAGTD